MYELAKIITHITDTQRNMDIELVAAALIYGEYWALPRLRR